MSCAAAWAVSLLLVQAVVLSDAFRVRSKKKAKVVVLGDSFSSGCGLYAWDAQYEDDWCWTDTKTTPGAQYARLTGSKFVNQACAAAKFPEVYEQLDTLEADYPEDAATGWSGSVLYFSIGGNDLHTSDGKSWGEVVRGCLTSLWGECHKLAENQVINLPDLQENATAFYAKIAESAPNAKIRIMGYPRLMQATWHCIPVPGLHLDAASWADGLMDDVNSRLKAAVDAVRVSTKGAVDISFVDMVDTLKGGACWITQKEINSIVLAGLEVTSSSFHPNQRGYDVYAQALADSVAPDGSLRLPPTAGGSSFSEGDVPFILDGWDMDKDGMLSKFEMSRMISGSRMTPGKQEKYQSFLGTIFDKADEDQDGNLNLEEFTGFIDLLAGAEAY